MLLFSSFLLSSISYANLRSAPAVPIDHCYHWLDAKAGYLQFKYTFAAGNQNELTFYTTPQTSKGAVAGAGLYCAKSPSQSHDYGSRVLRLELVDDVVIYDETSGKKYCGTHPTITDADCQKKPWDIKLYRRNPEWYVIQNPGAIARWSATSAQLVQDLQSESSLAESDYQAKIGGVIESMKSDAAGFNKVFQNGRARSNLADLLKTDPQRLFSIPVASVLAGLKSLNAQNCTAELKRWAEEVSVQRVFQDPELSWRDLHDLFNENPDLQKAFLKRLTSEFQNQPDAQKFKNTEALLRMVSLNAAALDASTIQRAVRLYFENPMAVPNDKALPQLSTSVIDAIRSELRGWIAKSDQSADLVKHLNVYQLVESHKIDHHLQKQLREQINQKILPQIKQSRLALNTGNNSVSVPLGSRSEQFTTLCRFQIVLHNLYDKDLFLGFGQTRYYQIGKITPSTDLTALCSQLKPMADRILQKKSTDIFVGQGTIQGIPFSFVAENREELEKTIQDFLRINPSLEKVDDVQLSVNGSPLQKQYNERTYWRGSEITQLILTLARAQGVQPQAVIDHLRNGKDRPYKISGQIYSGQDLAATLELAVDNNEMIETECRRLSTESEMYRVDRIVLKLNGVAVPQLENPRSYWYGTNAVCDQIRSSLALSVPPKRTLEAREKAARSTYRFQVVVQGSFPFIFYGENLEQVQAQCPAAIDEQRLGRVDLLMFEREGQARFENYNKSSYWRKTQEICDVVGAYAESFIPSAAQKAILDRTARFTLKARFGSRPLTFIYNSKEELTSQCQQLATGMNRFDRINWSVNGGSGQEIYNQRSYWNSANESCNALVQAVFPGN